jgi:hypothetical protein
MLADLFESEFILDPDPNHCFVMERIFVASRPPSIDRGVEVLFLNKRERCDPNNSAGIKKGEVLQKLMLLMLLIMAGSSG